MSSTVGERRRIAGVAGGVGAGAALRGCVETKVLRVPEKGLSHRGGAMK
jgi:hypothetical protein